MYQLGHFLAEQKSILSSQEEMSLFGTQGNFNKMIKKIACTYIPSQYIPSRLIK